MAKLILKYEAAILREFPVQRSSISIGRAPGNDIVIDNLAVSGHHAKLQIEDGQFIVEDLNSLNGTFLNNQRIRKSALKDGDEIVIGKHTLIFQDEGDSSAQMAKSDEEQELAGVAGQTMVLDTKKRREFLAKATALAKEGASEAAEKIGSLVVLSGRTAQPEYILTSKLSLIGKDARASVRLKGWFLPKVAAVINRRSEHYDIAPSETAGVTRVNGEILAAPRQLKEGDLIEIKKVKLQFYFRE
jgi:pSer/pThr/pTyr-binding forkhead associated (FHA) protein